MNPKFGGGINFNDALRNRDGRFGKGSNRFGFEIVVLLLLLLGIGLEEDGVVRVVGVGWDGMDSV